MSSKATGEPKCKSVMEAGSVEISESSESTGLNPSKELFSLCTLSYMFSKETNTKAEKKQTRILENRMQKMSQKVKSGKETMDNIVTLAQIYYNVCEVYVDLDIEKQYFATYGIVHCLNLIKDKELNRKTILLALEAFCLAGKIYHRQEKIEKAIEVCNKAVELYSTYMERKNEYGTPIDLRSTIFQIPEEPDTYTKLEDSYLNNLRSLMKLHTSIGSTNEMIMCTHIFLATEFKRLSKVHEYFNWIEATMNLSDYFLTCRRFIEAKNHLIVASFVKRRFIDEKYYNIVNQQKLSLEVMVSYEQHDTTYMLFTIHWIRYGMELLRMPATRLKWLEEDYDCESSRLKSKGPAKSSKRVPQKLLLFREIQEEFSITDEYAVFKNEHISDYNAAKEVFLSILKMLNDAITPDNYHEKTYNEIISHTTYILYVSNAYKYMARYEKDNTTSQAMLQRRVDILALTVSNIVIPGKSSSFCPIVKHLKLQMAIAYSTLIYAKFQSLEAVRALNMTDKYEIIINEIKDLVSKGALVLHMYIKKP